MFSKIDKRFMALLLSFVFLFCATAGTVHASVTENGELVPGHLYQYMPTSTTPPALDTIPTTPTAITPTLFYMGIAATSSVYPRGYIFKPDVRPNFRIAVEPFYTKTLNVPIPAYEELEFFLELGLHVHNNIHPYPTVPGLYAQPVAWQVLTNFTPADLASLTCRVDPSASVHTGLPPGMNFRTQPAYVTRYDGPGGDYLPYNALQDNLIIGGTPTQWGTFVVRLRATATDLWTYSTVSGQTVTAYQIVKIVVMPSFDQIHPLTISNWPTNVMPANQTPSGAHVQGYPVTIYSGTPPTGMTFHGWYNLTAPGTPPYPNNQWTFNMPQNLKHVIALWEPSSNLNLTDHLLTVINYPSAISSLVQNQTPGGTLHPDNDLVVVNFGNVPGWLRNEVRGVDTAWNIHFYEVFPAYETYTNFNIAAPTTVTIFWIQIMHDITVTAPPQGELIFTYTSPGAGVPSLPIIIPPGITQTIPVPEGSDVNVVVRPTTPGYEVDPGQNPNWNVNGGGYWYYEIHNVTGPATVPPPSMVYNPSGGDNTVTIIAPPNGSVTVTYQPPGGGGPIITVTVNPGDQPQTITIPPNYVVNVVVTPDVGFNICPDWIAYNPYFPTFTMNSPETPSTIAPILRPGGTITVIAPPQGSVTVTFQPPGGGSPSTTITIPPGTTLEDIYIPNGMEVTIVVNPNPGWEVNPGWNGGNPAWPPFIMGSPQTPQQPIAPVLRQIPAGGERPAPLPIITEEEPTTAPPALTPQTPPAERVHHHRAYVRGYPDGTFGPDHPMTRAEMVEAFLNLTEGAHRYARIGNRFLDVSQGDWFYPAVAYFTNIGALSGFPDGTFRPNRYITNAEFASFAVRAFNLERFGIRHDVQGIQGHWAENAIRIGFDVGWFLYFGDDYVFDPDALITRAQAVTLLNHYTGRIPNEDDIDIYLGTRILYSDVHRWHWAFYEIMEASISHYFIRRENVEHWVFGR